MVQGLSWVKRDVVSARTKMLRLITQTEKRKVSLVCKFGVALKTNYQDWPYESVSHEPKNA